MKNENSFFAVFLYIRAQREISEQNACQLYGRFRTLISYPLSENSQKTCFEKSEIIPHFVLIGNSLFLDIVFHEILPEQRKILIGIGTVLIQIDMKKVTVFFYIGDHGNQTGFGKKAVKENSLIFQEPGNILHHLFAHFIDQIVDIQIMSIKGRTIDIGGFTDAADGDLPDVGAFEIPEICPCP